MLWEVLSLALVAFVFAVPINGLIASGSSNTHYQHQCNEPKTHTSPEKNGGRTSSCPCSKGGYPCSSGTGCSGGNCGAALPSENRSVSTTSGNFIIRGYRRLNAKNLLNHEKRINIFNTLNENPGISIDTLIQFTGINQHTLRYHLWSLISNKIVIKIKVNGTDHYFLKQSDILQTTMLPLAYQKHSSTSRTLCVISDNPGICRSDLASFLGISGPSVTRQLDQLVAVNCVRSEKDGRFTRYYMNNTGLVPD